MPPCHRSRCWSRPVTRLVACGLGVALALPAARLAAQSDCSPRTQNTFVRDTLQNIYYWYRELPAVDPGAFESPEALLEAVRYRPLDNTFSYITSRQASEAFFSDSQFVGFGFGNRLVAADDLRVTQVFPDSPAAEAGLVRGERILEIGGRPVAELAAAGALGAAFGPSEIGVSVELLVRAADGSARRVGMTKRLVTIPTVSDVRVIESEGRRIGYVHFRNFVQPSTLALDGAFRELRAQGASELVLDLRYNGGGLVAVAQHLGGLIGGVRTNGQTFAVFAHNDKNTFRDQTLRFADPPEALDFERLTVITTRASASASELIINALRPHLPVYVVGENTFGKPVGQYGYNFCEKVVYPVAFTLKNAKGEADYFNGFAPDCPAADDLEHPLGDPAEASLAEALHVARTGTCRPSTRAGRPFASWRGGERPGERGAWRVVVGAD